MKKTQVALAALALVASTAAMADGVKVSGQMDVGVGHTTGVGSYMDQGAWADNSNITFSGSEDMGSGMKAFFTLAAGFTQNGDPGNGGNGTLFSREEDLDRSEFRGSRRPGGGYRGNECPGGLCRGDG